MHDEMRVDVCVVGGGPGGLAAALAAKKEAPQLRVLIIERDRMLGGILQQCIHNGFGLHYFSEELTGPEYAQRFIERLGGSGIEVMTDTMVLQVGADKSVLAVSKERGLMRIQAGTVILAMGCRERTRGALSIPGTRPAGVYTAGCAQRLVNMEGFLPGNRVVVLGSGDIGLIMARRMQWSGAKVLMVCEIMPYSSGLNRNIVQCLHDNGIPLKFNHTVTQIHGKQRVEGVSVAQVDPQTKRPIPGTEQRIDCDTLLLSVGLIPENELTKGMGIGLSPVTQGATVDENRMTERQGVFACGNVLHVHDLVDNVSVEAELAGRAAARYAMGQCQGADCVRVLAQGGVRYAVPQRITQPSEGPLTLYFRVDNTYRDARLQVRSGQALLWNRKKSVMTPGEMESVTIDAGQIQGDVVLTLMGGDEA